jgi:hypothetical protein
MCTHMLKNTRIQVKCTGSANTGTGTTLGTVSYRYFNSPVPVLVIIINLPLLMIRAQQISYLKIKEYDTVLCQNL